MSDSAQKRLQRYKDVEARAIPRRKNIDKLALRLAELSRKNTQERYQAITGRDFSEADESQIRYGVTMICNRCGSTGVGITESYRDGHYDGYDFRCNSCEGD